jgi:hypothetical protein
MGFFVHFEGSGASQMGVGVCIRLIVVINTHSTAYSVGRIEPELLILIQSAILILVG